MYILYITCPTGGLPAGGSLTCSRFNNSALMMRMHACMHAAAARPRASAGLPAGWPAAHPQWALGDARGGRGGDQGQAVVLGRQGHLEAPNDQQPRRAHRSNICTRRCHTYAMHTAGTMAVPHAQRHPARLSACGPAVGAEHMHARSVITAWCLPEGGKGRSGFDLCARAMAIWRMLLHTFTRVAHSGTRTPGAHRAQAAAPTCAASHTSSLGSGALTAQAAFS